MILKLNPFINASFRDGKQRRKLILKRVLLFSRCQRKKSILKKNKEEDGNKFFVHSQEVKVLPGLGYTKVNIKSEKIVKPQQKKIPSNKPTVYITTSKEAVMWFQNQRILDLLGN